MKIENNNMRNYCDGHCVEFPAERANVRNTHFIVGGSLALV